jgi:mycothiol synthase
VVEIRPAHPSELRDALSVIFTQPGAESRDTQAQVTAFIEHYQNSPLFSQAHWVAIEDGTIQAAVACLDSPGRTGLLFLPSMRLHPTHKAIIIELVQQVVRSARDRGLKLFQALIPPDSDAEGYVLASAGFDPLAELIYMERPSTLPIPDDADPETLSWTTYSPQTHCLFAQVILATYEQSLDCPRLSGLRDIEDIIASHMATGQFNPNTWFVIHLSGVPVGCLLLARLPRRSALELVYMGMVPKARGQGLGGVMLRQAIRQAVKTHTAYISLAVDRDNAPACKLYKKFRFNETIRRTAWISTAFLVGT